MQLIQEDSPPAVLAAAVDANTVAYYASYAAYPGATFRRDNGVQRLSSGTPVDIFNAVVQARLDEAAADAAIAATLAEYGGAGLPFVWHIGPTSAPADLHARLLAHGMAHYEDEPGMAAGLLAAPEPPAPVGLRIVTVAGAEMLRDWVAVWLGAEGAAVRADCARILGAVEHGPAADHQLLLGLLDGRPVATAALFAGAGVISVQHVVTAAEQRRRGVGAAMTHAVLRAGRARGYRVAVLTASPVGRAVYERLGFREVCVVRRYVASAPQA